MAGMTKVWYNLQLQRKMVQLGRDGLGPSARAYARRNAGVTWRLLNVPRRLGLTGSRAGPRQGSIGDRSDGR